MLNESIIKYLVEGDTSAFDKLKEKNFPLSSKRDTTETISKLTKYKQNSSYDRLVAVLEQYLPSSVVNAVENQAEFNSSKNDKVLIASLSKMIEKHGVKYGKRNSYTSYLLAYSYNERSLTMDISKDKELFDQLLALEPETQVGRDFVFKLTCSLLYSFLVRSIVRSTAEVNTLIDQVIKRGKEHFTITDELLKQLMIIPVDTNTDLTSAVNYKVKARMPVDLYLDCIFKTANTTSIEVIEDTAFSAILGYYIRSELGKDLSNYSYKQYSYLDTSYRDVKSPVTIDAYFKQRDEELLRKEIIAGVTLPVAPFSSAEHPALAALQSANNLTEVQEVISNWGQSSVKIKTGYGYTTIPVSTTDSYILDGDLTEIAKAWRSRYFMQTILLMRFFANKLTDEQILWCLTHKSNGNIQAGAMIFMELLMKSVAQYNISSHNPAQGKLGSFNVHRILEKRYSGSGYVNLRKKLEDKFTLSYASYALFIDTGE